MNYKTIEDIYAGNDSVRARLRALVSSLTPEQATALPEGEKWTVAQIVEHISIVDESSMKICAKLLRKALVAGRSSDGKAVISDNFMQKGSEIAAIKVEAPAFVHPTGGSNISESLERLDETAAHLQELREQFESLDGTEFTFPHPFFGDISAHEWLALKGGHEMRHIKQIERLLEAIKE